ncbi:MAG: hypothetical protein IK081_00130 [Lachnospiraceae bacterium]|nr:hypothetical protein [Lachnospiraceae bacterium]
MKDVSPIKALVVGAILKVIGFIVAVVGVGFKFIPVIVLGALMIIGGAIYEIMYFRCPYCGSMLGSRGRYDFNHVPGFCRECGKQYTGFAEPPEKKPEEVDYEPWKKFK